MIVLLSDFFKMFRRIKSEEKFLSSSHSTHNAPGDHQASPTMAIPVLATSKQPLLAQFCVPAVRSTFGGWEGVGVSS